MICPKSCHSEKPKLQQDLLKVPFQLRFIVSTESSHKYYIKRSLHQKQKQNKTPSWQELLSWIWRTQNFPFGGWDLYPSERNTHGNKSSRWRGCGSASISPLPLSFNLSQELFYFDSCCHHQGKSPSPRAGEGEKMREVLSLFSSQLKVNMIFLLVFLSTTETGWHIQHEIYQTLRKTRMEIKKIRSAQSRWLITKLLTREEGYWAPSSIIFP